MSGEPPPPPRGPTGTPRSEDDASAPPERQLDGASGLEPTASPWGPAWLRAVGLLVGSLIAVNAFAAILLAVLLVLGMPFGLTAALVVQVIAQVPTSALIVASWLLAERLDAVRLGLAGGARRVARGLGTGALVGSGAMTALVVGGLAAGGYAVAGAAPPAERLAAVGLILPLAFAAFFEELLFRGHLMQTLGRSRPLVGILVSSLAFAAVHSLNPGAWSGGLPTSLLLVTNLVLAGVWLATLFVRSGDLWLPTGAHVGWNATQGVVFGLPVSGLDLPSLLQGTLAADGSIAWGGLFGPESAAVSTLVLAALTLEGALACRGVPLPCARADAREELVACSSGSMQRPDDEVHHS